MLADAVAPSGEGPSSLTVRILLTCGTFAVLFTVLCLFVFCFLKFCPASPEQGTDRRSESNRKAAVEQVLATFPEFTYGADESPAPTSCSFSAVCSICLEEYEVGDCLRVLPNCDHVFHRGCIDLWLSTRSSSCPICRDQAVARHDGDSAAPGGNCRNGGGQSRPAPFLNMNFGGDLL
ncbi:unnamed protein product [Linum tenue]|uniref:RING-type E3 ubiquitin transferase n=1 Tax=Linum tenue TaxID=586396 RepID=A0AAV0I9C7_9ROSI|nr:unnamed protein product [Linum tenue]